MTVLDQFRLDGKTALVTGARRGIGMAMAMALAEAGADIIAVSANMEASGSAIERAVKALGCGFAAYRCDLSDRKALYQLIEQVHADGHIVDILVNNAGILYPTRIDHVTKAEWDQVLDVNLNGTFLCSKAVLQTMKENGYGRIVNMSSSAGRSVSTLGGIHYTAAKAGVLGLTRAMAKEVAPFGITVNAVCPGLIDTEMVRIECTPERIKGYEESFPISRLGTPEEVAQLILFLVTDSKYITGASIDINGGDLMM